MTLDESASVPGADAKIVDGFVGFEAVNADCAVGVEFGLDVVEASRSGGSEGRGEGRDLFGKGGPGRGGVVLADPSSGGEAAVIGKQSASVRSASSFDSSLLDTEQSVVGARLVERLSGMSKDLNILMRSVFVHGDQDIIGLASLDGHVVGLHCKEVSARMERERRRGSGALANERKAAAPSPVKGQTMHSRSNPYRPMNC